MSESSIEQSEKVSDTGLNTVGERGGMISAVLDSKYDGMDVVIKGDRGINGGSDFELSFLRQLRSQLVFFLRPHQSALEKTHASEQYRILVPGLASCFSHVALITHND